MPDAEAVVVALKSRTVPAAEAIDKSLAALAWLRTAGARQILFKYCSTFDSTDAGNIGPVAEALMTHSAPISPCSARLFPKRGGRSIAAICSSATYCCPNRGCATTR